MIDPKWKSQVLKTVGESKMYWANIIYQMSWWVQCCRSLSNLLMNTPTVWGPLLYWYHNAPWDSPHKKTGSRTSARRLLLGPWYIAWRHVIFYVVIGYGGGRVWRVLVSSGIVRVRKTAHTTYVRSARKTNLLPYQKLPWWIWITKNYEVGWKLL
jgi:hypothetical protein